MAQPYTIRIAGSDVQFAVEPDETILDAALRLGLPAPYGCKNGHCGACRAQLVDGNVHYKAPPQALSGQEREAGLTLLCEAQPDSDVTLDVQLLAADGHLRARNLPARLNSRTQLAHDVWQVELQVPKAKPFDFLPGQYIDFLLPDGSRRSFSLAAPPNADNVLQMQLRKVPGGSFVQHVVDDLDDCAVLRIQGPLGGFFMRDAPQRPAVFIAGGTGFAPIRAMLMAELAAGQTKPLHLYWGVRARRDLYDAELAESWARAHSNVQFTPVLSDPEPGDDWTGRRGFVHQVVAEDFPDCSGVDVYASGPPVLVEAAKRDLGKQGLKPARTFYDAFEYAHVTWPALDGDD